MAMREVSSADHQEVASLLSEAASGLVERRGGAALAERWLEGADASEAYLKLLQHLSELRHVLFVDDEAVAVAWLEGSQGWLSVYVAHERRRQGRGPRILAPALAWLETNAESIDALALPGDRDWKSLLEKSGFKARLLTLRRDA